MISALRQQGGPSHLWNGATRSYLSETWSTRNVVPLLEIRPNPGGFDGSEAQRLSGGSEGENTLFILIGTTAHVHGDVMAEVITPTQVSCPPPGRSARRGSRRVSSSCTTHWG